MADAAALAAGVGPLAIVPAGGGDTAAARGTADRFFLTGNTLDEADKTVPAEWLWLLLRRTRREGFVIKFLIYVAFVGLFTAITQMVRPVRSTYSVQDTLLEHTAREAFPQANWQKTFYDISCDADWWEWAETVLLPTILSDEYFNGDSRAETWGSRFINTVSMYNTQTATVRFRQARVTDDSCDTPADNSELARPCWGYFSVARQFKSSFGEGYGNRYLTGLRSIVGKEGFGADYGTEAHVVDLPLAKGRALGLAAQMKANMWLNEQTRAISVETSWYNANLDLSTYVMWHVDISPGGRFQPYIVVHSCRLSPYATTEDKIRLVLECIFIIWLICYWAVEFKEMRLGLRIYFSIFWNWIELINLSFFLFIVIWWFVYVAKDKKPFEVVSDATHSVRPDLSDLASHFNFTSNFAAFNMIFSYLKIFKYLQWYPSLSLLWRTLRLSLTDVVPFMFVFLLFTCGFTFAAHWIFGFTMLEFHSWWQSFSTLIQSLLGGLPFHDMKRYAPVSAAIFSVAWVLTMSMVFSSMFVAILTGWYLEVHEDCMTEESKLVDKVGNRAKDGLFGRFFRALAQLLPCKKKDSAVDDADDFDFRAREVTKALKRADLRNTEHVRRALMSDRRLSVSELSRHFNGDDQATFDFVQKMRELAETEEVAQAGQASPVSKYRSKPTEAQERERLVRLQATARRLEDHLRKLREALHKSEIAPAINGQSLDGYQVAYQELPGAVPEY